MAELPRTAIDNSLLTATLPLSTRLERTFGARVASLPTETRSALLGCLAQRWGRAGRDARGRRFSARRRAGVAAAIAALEQGAELGVESDRRADRLLRAADLGVEEADLSGWPLERGRVQLAFGEWLRRRRRTADSQVHLRAAKETFAPQ